jgi:PmbA protein
MAESKAHEVLAAAAARVEAAEVYEEIGESVIVRFEDSRLKQIDTRQRHGVGLRVIANGRIGFASTTDLRDTGRLVDMATASAQYGDEALFEMPGQPEDLSPPEMWDDRVPRVTARDMVDIGRAGLELCREADKDWLFFCHISRSTGTVRLLNTSGLALEHSGTRMSGDVEVQEVSDNGLLQVYEHRTWRQPFDSIAEITGTAVRKMRDAANVVPARLETMPMVFVPKALHNLFMSLSVALNGKQVHKGASVLKDRIGDQILDDRLTVFDDPTVPFAPASCATDGEGIPARRQPVFENGVLRTYLADLQTAALLGIKPTGHGFRGYSSRPAPGGTNSVMSPGDTPFADMVCGMDRGLVIEQTLGSGQSNILAGEFSVNLDLAFLVENGQVVGRVKDCMVAGNVYDVLRSVEAVGSECTWLGSACAPPIMVGGLRLAAQG